MLISTGKRYGPKGFTLVEILVVLLIIGLTLGMVSRLDYSSGPQVLKNEARSFADTASLVLDEAVLSGDYWGIDFFTRESSRGTIYGYRWLRRKNDIWQQAVPVGMDDFPESSELDAGYTLGLFVEGLPLEAGRKVDLDDPDLVPEDFSPDVWLYPDHESTPFTVSFSYEDSGSMSVTSDLLGRFQLKDS